MSQEDVRAALRARRIGYWGSQYLASTCESYRLAQRFFGKSDFFTAFLYLFVTFNNLYSLLAPDRTDDQRIREAVGRVPLDRIETLYSSHYVGLIRQLNDGPPVQFNEGPDGGAAVEGIPNMREYFRGKEAAQCVAHVDEVAPDSASAQAKRKTLQEVAACLLYAVRNNQFHAVKGAQNLSDQTTLRTAYQILDPIVSALLPIGEEVIDNFRAASTQHA